jgi:hypothetical protein
MQGFTDALSQCQKLWNKEYAFAQMTLDGSARAHVLNQHWYAYARVIFAGDSGVVFSREQFQRYLVIDEKIILRFKLLDGQLCVRNYPTEHAVDWRLQIPLQGLPPCIRLHYGYRMDITGTKVRDAFIILPLGEHNEWVWQTSGEPIDTFGFQLLLPQARDHEPMVYWYDNYPLAE